MKNSLMSKILKSLAAVVTLALLAIGGGLGSAEKAGHVETTDYLTLDLEPMASVVELAPHYKTEKTFISKVYEADQEFQLLGLNWDQQLPQSTKSSIQIRFRSVEGAWSDWEQIEVDQDGSEGEDGFWTYMITENSDAFQYKANLSTQDTSVTPRIANVSFDYVDGGEQSMLGKLSKLVFKSDDSVISRSSWGADENYRLAKNVSLTDEGEVEEELDNNDLADDPDMEIINTVKNDSSGNTLLWPQEYPKKVKKFIVHHTATTSNLDNPEQAIRAIYYYHAVTRGWGDIGYNYVIDQAGNVYEGRAGGDGVVAGHSAGYNTGSIGIAVLGNYEENAVTGESVQSLMDLIYEKAKINEIDVDGTSEFRSEITANILGHKDVASTTCPGENLYEILDDIAMIVGKAQDQPDAEDLDEGNSFEYEDMTKLDLLALSPQDKQSVAIRIKNTGSQTWDKNTFLTANADFEADNIVSISKDSKKAIAYMKQSQVKPGQYASFTFNIESDLEDGLAHFDMIPVFNGETKSAQAMDLGIYVEKPILDFDVVSSDAPATMQPAQKTSVTLVLENTSNFTWHKSGEGAIELKRSGSSNLTSSTTLAAMQEDEVAPGENGTFKFDIKAPTSGGKYSLYFTPEVPSYGLTTSTAGSLSVTVESSSSKALMTDYSSDLNFAAGETKTMWIKVKNVSTEKWTTTGDNAFNLAFSGSEKMEVSNAKMAIKSFNPNVTTRIFFNVTAPQTAGTYKLYLMPRLGSTNLVSSAFELELTVGEAGGDASSDYENPIRIKLTPDTTLSNVVLQSNDTFGIYDDDELIKTIPSTSFVRVTPSSGQYAVSSGSYRGTFDGPIRAVASGEDSYIKVASMNQLAAWDSTINDNKFRGTIEVRTINSELVLINELPLEDYVKGIAEETNTTPNEKLKAMSILARTYGYYYMTKAEKFSGMPYNLDDDPSSSQKYLGYGYEERNPNVVAAAEATKDMVVTYKGDVVKTPYFSQSDGTKTKSAASVWGWTNTPYLQSVSDAYCTATSFSGHGVGLSGCGAKAMAQQGFTFEEIIKYYYTGVEIESIK